MFFTKEDRKTLNLNTLLLHKILKECSIPMVELHPTQQKVLDRLNTIQKQKEIKVSGSMDLSGAAEEEEDIIRENIAARLSQETTNRPFFEEERLDARELEVME